MAANKTKLTEVSVASFVNALTEPTRRLDAKALMKLMKTPPARSQECGVRRYRILLLFTPGLVFPRSLGLGHPQRRMRDGRFGPSPHSRCSYMATCQRLLKT